MAYGAAHANLQFPPHPDTKPKSVPQNNMPMYQQNLYQPRMNIQELVQVPPELASFASDPQFQTILLKVKEQTMINFISLNRSPTAPDCVESISIDAPSRESAQLARGLIETHFKLQAKLKHAETRLQKVQTDLFSAQGEIASGMMIEFSIDPELVGLALGKKGARIKQIEQDTKVTSINVTGETGRIMVVGPDSQSVQRARELLELQEECIPLESHQIEWLSNKFNSGFLHDIKTGSDLIVTRVNSEKFTLDIVGTLQAVRSARFMLSTQLEYVEKQIEIEASERAAREKLQQMRKQYGMPGGRYDYENRDRGDRERSDRDRPSNNNNYNRDRTTNNNTDRNDRGDRGDRQGDRQQNTGARTSSAPSNSQTSAAGNNNRGSRSNGQDSLVNLQNNASNGNNKKVGSSAQAVAEAVGNAYKKSATTPAPAANAGDAKNSSRGQSNQKTDKKDAAPVPMLQQVLQKQGAANPEARAQNKKKETTAAAATTSTPQQGRKNQTKNDMDAVTEGVKNLKVDNTQKTEKRNTNKAEKVDAKPAAADAAPAKTANNNDKRRHNNKAAEPAPAPVGRIVEYEEVPLPKRQNNRNKKTVDSLATVGATVADAPVATVSTAESAAEGESESKRRRPAGNKKTKSDGASTADTAVTDATPVKDAAKDASAKEPKAAKPAKSAKNSDSAKEGKAEKAGASTPPGLPNPQTSSKSAAEVVPAAPVSVSGPPAVPIAVAVVSAEQA
uniref:K Homology domain-containing protein n=1 Tax=Spumella elongata TaxID=89044 RepID=A0A7S3M9F7_9STRA